ncbi:MAG: class I SAM-dependent methyltransferase [Actinomycetota bacterium]
MTNSGPSQQLACPTCLAPLTVASPTECRSCGAVFPVVHETVQCVDWRTYADQPTDLLAGWHLTQLASEQLYLDGAADSVSTSDRADVAEVRDFLEADGLRLLDVGSGSFHRPGYVSDGVAEFVGVDPMPPAQVPPFPLVTAFAERLPFADDRFDTVLFATSLDHVLHVPTAIREADRVLASGGSIVFWGGFVDDETAYRECVDGSTLRRDGREDPDSAATARSALDLRLEEIEDDRANHEHLLLDEFHVRHFSTRSLIQVFADEGYVATGFRHLQAGHAVSSTVIRFTKMEGPAGARALAETRGDLITLAAELVSAQAMSAFGDEQLQAFIATQVDYVLTAQANREQVLRDELAASSLEVPTEVGARLDDLDARLESIQARLRSAEAERDALRASAEAPSARTRVRTLLGRVRSLLRRLLRGT